MLKVCMRKPCWAWRSNLATDFYTRIEPKSLQTTVIQLFLGNIRLNCSWAEFISNLKELISDKGPPIQPQWETEKLLTTFPSNYICKQNVFRWIFSLASLIRPTELSVHLTDWERVNQIQPAPCFGRSPVDWQVLSKILIAVGNQYGLESLRSSSLVPSLQNNSPL